MSFSLRMVRRVHTKVEPLIKEKMFPQGTDKYRLTMTDYRLREAMQTINIVEKNLDK